MQKFILYLSMLTLLVFLTACGNGDEEGTEDTASDAVDDFEITLTYSDHDPPNGMRTDFIENVWIPEIESETDGRVTINSTFGGGLLSSQEALDGLRDGVADMGLIFPDFYPERMFTYQIFKLFPEAPEDFESLNDIFDESMEELPGLTEELEENNQMPLLVTLGLPTVLGSSEPIENVSDIQGADWRASSIWHLETLEHIGANPVSVPWEDVYMSLETGVIDGVMTNYDGYHMMNFYEGAPEVILGTRLWWASPFMHTINMDTWNELPEDIQDGILRATETAQEEFASVYEEELEQTIQEQEGEGVNIKIADDEDVAHFTDAELLENMRESWVSEAESDHGIEDAEEYIEEMERIMNEALGEN